MRVKGFTLIELMVVILIMSYIMYQLASFQQRQQEIENYKMSVENDAYVIDVVATALSKYASLQTGMANNAKIQVDLSDTEFTKFLPTGFISTPLPSDMTINAYIVNGETYPGSGEFVKRSIIVPIPPGP